MPPCSRSASSGTSTSWPAKCRAPSTAFSSRPRLREILDAILLSNGYNYRAVGKSLVVSSIAELGQINPFFQSATIPVRSADIDEVVRRRQAAEHAARARCGAEIGAQHRRARFSRPREDDPRVRGHARRRRQRRDSPSPDSRNGVPLEVGYFRTQHITAKTAEQALQAVLSKDGRVGVMEKEDRLLVTDYAENLAMVEKVLERIDQPRPQVRITALIYDISLQDIEQLGINWNPIGQGAASTPPAIRRPSLGIDSVTHGAVPSRQRLATRSRL